MSADQISWIPAANPPENDDAVLLFDPNAFKPVWLGYADGGVWRYVDGELAQPTFWSEMPKGPKA